MPSLERVHLAIESFLERFRRRTSPARVGFAANAFASRGAATRTSTSSFVSSHQGSRRNASSSATGSAFASALLLARDASSFSRAAIAEAVAVSRREDTEASPSSADGTSSRPDPPPKQHARHPPPCFASTPMPRKARVPRAPPVCRKREKSFRFIYCRKVSFERQLARQIAPRAALAAGCRVRTTTKSFSSGRRAMAVRWRATRSACDTTRRTAPLSVARPRRPCQIRQRRGTRPPCSGCSRPMTRTTRPASACPTSSEALCGGRWCPTSKSISTSCRTMHPSCSPSSRALAARPGRPAELDPNQLPEQNAFRRVDDAQARDAAVGHAPLQVFPVGLPRGRARRRAHRQPVLRGPVRDVQRRVVAGLPGQDAGARAAHETSEFEEDLVRYLHRTGWRGRDEGPRFGYVGPEAFRAFDFTGAGAKLIGSVSVATAAPTCATAVRPPPGDTPRCAARWERCASRDFFAARRS